MTFGGRWTARVLMVLAALTLTFACKRRDSTGTAGKGGAGAGGQVAGRGGAGTGTAGQSGGSAGASNARGGATGAWTAVPGVSPCVLEAADPAEVAVVPLAWSDCGPGCSTTPSKVLATDDTVLASAASARFDGRELLLRLATMSGSSYYVIAVRRLPDGELVAGVRAPGPTQASCGPLGLAPSAAHVLGFFKSGMPGSNGVSSTVTYVVGLLTSRGLVWSPPLPDVPFPETGAFENDLGWGVAVNDGTLRTMFPADTGPFTVVDRGAVYPSHSSVGRGTLLVSNPALSGSLDEVIRAWEPDRPSRTIVAQTDTDIPAVALSDTMMTWVGVHGPNRWDGTYTAAELYWTPFPAGKDPVPIMGGTTIPAAHGLTELQTWGDYAAVLGTDQAGRRVLFVVRMSDGRLWTIAARSGNFYLRLLVVTPTLILLGENDGAGTAGYQMQRLTRFEITRLDDLAAAW